MSRISVDLLLHSLRRQKTRLILITTDTWLSRSDRNLHTRGTQAVFSTGCRLPTHTHIFQSNPASHTRTPQSHRSEARQGKMSSFSAKLLWVAVRDRLASLLAFIVTGVKIMLGTAMACFLVIILVVVLWAFYITSGIDFDQVGIFYIFRLLHPYHVFLDSCCLLRKVANTSGFGVYSWKSLRIII